MASFTQVSKRKRARKHKNAGRDRKRRMGEKSTASYDELFAACGEPGKPVPSKPPQPAKG